MKVIGFLLKTVVKMVVFPLLFLMIFIQWIANILINVSAYIISPVMLFVLGCGIYSVVKASWLNVALLTGIELGLFVLVFGANWIVMIMEDLCDGLMGFMHS
ncbi:MAG: hypothetical protein Q4B26_01110 [Eubacteriales bacterium]|nr:hypothetical protein [Eubacteriales bacterium]